MILLAGFFGSFLLYLALGLLALLATSALDKLLGKERALLVYVIGVLGLTWALKPSMPPPLRPVPAALVFQSQRNDPTVAVKATIDPFARDPLGLRGERNAFQEMSDTSPLPPERLAEPPGVPMAFPFPPTVPGVGFASRYRYRGDLPLTAAPAAAAPGDSPAPGAAGSGGDGKPAATAAGMPDVPADGFFSYVETAEDVYDWMTDGGQKVFVFLRGIDEAKHNSPEFNDPASGLKWMLEGGEAPPGSQKVWADLSVSFSYVGSEADAKKKLDPRSQTKVKQSPPTSIAASKHETWHLRNTIDNMYVRACRKQGRPRAEDLSVDQMKAVAAEMARVGESGKENGKGWDKAIDVLKLALSKCKQPPTRDATDVLLAMIDAYRARQNERDLVATLTEYMASATASAARSDASRWLGDVLLSRLRLAERAVELYDRALTGQPGAKSLEGRGDAKSYLGLHAEALKDYREASTAGARGTAAVKEAEALLRMGKLAEAMTAAQAALGAGAFDPRALLVKGAVQYAEGDVQAAGDTFRQICVLPSDDATRRHRAEALYDLGLCEWRLGHTATAGAAFDAVEAALRRGSSRGRNPDESVSPELGRALIQLSAGNVGEAHDALDRARDLAPGIAYVEFLAGWIASNRRDAAEARARFESALALAPDLFELDGWLAETRLRGAEAAVLEGSPPGDHVADFEAAARYAERATARELEANPKNTDFAVREALVRLRQQQLSERKRFEAALKTATDILAKAREERRALAIRGYCNYRLGVGEPEKYGECLRNFQSIVDLPAPPNDALKAYAQLSLDTVKRWQALEEKSVEFAETKLSTEWEAGQSHGIRVSPDDGWLVIKDLTKDAATDDGTETDPTAFVRTKKLVGKDSLELVQAWIRVPKKDANGNEANNILVGLVLQPPSQAKGGLVKGQGIGVFYDKGRISVKVTGGNDNYYKDGMVKRAKRDTANPASAEFDWPEDKDGRGVLVEIERKSADGDMSVRVGGQEIVADRIATFRRSKGDLELWIGGWSTRAQNWNVGIDRVRVVRRKP